MSTTENEVSVGFPTDGQMFQPPQVNLDSRKPRYVSFIGSLVEPDIVRSRPWTKGGGIEISNPCLRYVKNFIRKGRITPVLLDKHDFLPYDYVKKMTDVDPLSAGYYGQSVPQGYVPPSLPPASGMHAHGFGGALQVGGPSPYGSMVAKAAFPGEQIHAITNGDENITQTNVPRGVVELETLLGYDYRPTDIDGVYVDPTIWQAQRTIFPTYPVLPVLLDDLERLLDAATIHTSLRAITDELMESLIQFRDYATETVRQVHNSMRESSSKGGYIWRYTAMDIVLLEQLGMNREDRQIRDEAKSAPKNERLEGMFEQFMALQIEEKRANLERLKRVEDMPPVDENTMKAEPLKGYSGYGGQSGYSGFSGEIVAADANETIDPPENEETVDEPLSNPVMPAALDLNGPRPAQYHHKTWEKMQREAGIVKE